MNIAYLIIAHTDPIQVSRLIHSLHIEKRTHFFVHIDGKTDENLFIKEIGNDDYITYVKNRVKVYWGGVFTGDMRSYTFQRMCKL